MKKTKLILLFASLACLWQPLQAQDWNWDEWFRQKRTQRKYLAQQIAALQLYLGYLKKGYTITQEGIGLVRSIREGEHDLHDIFYHSLLQVPLPVKQYPNSARILAHSTFVKKEVAALLDITARTSYLRAADKEHIQRSCRALLADTEKTLDAMVALLQDNALQMTDDQRLTRINQLYEQSCRQWQFARTFSGQARLVIRQRLNETMELELLKKQYQLD